MGPRGSGPRVNDSITVLPIANPAGVPTAILNG